MAIIDVASYKAWFGISATTYDAQLAVIIPAVQSAIENWTGRVFDTATFTEKLDGTGTDAIMLKNPPVASVTSVTFTYGADSVTLQSTDFAFSTGATGRLWLLSDAGWTAWQGDYPGSDHSVNRPCFPKGRENITVVYVGGYATAPAGLKMAMYLLCQRVLLNASGSGDPAMKSEGLGNYNYTRMTPQEMAAVAEGVLAIGTDAQQLLNGYRRVGEC